MKTKLKATIIIECEYEADSENYNNVDSISEMIKIDEDNFKNDSYQFIDSLIDFGADVNIKIIEIKE